jgi:hypothetical protein
MANEVNAGRGKKNNHRPGWKNARRTQRHADAVARNEKNKRSPQEQLKVLDERLGVGVGAVRERKKLLSKIENG